MGRIPIALTMYTVRQSASEDYLGTVRQVAQMGYEGIQTHFQVTDPKELRTLADDMGFEIAGVHTAWEALVNDFDAAVEYNKALRCRDISCPSLPPEFRSAEGFAEAGRVLSDIGRRLRERELRLTYHNHAFEFQSFEGQSGYDILFESADAQALATELDVYWLEHAGQDPVTFIRRFAGRAPLLHIKDMEAGEERFFAEVGEGILDWPAIFQAAQDAAVEWMIVEQDECRRPPLESARISLENALRFRESAQSTS